MGFVFPKTGRQVDWGIETSRGFPAWESRRKLLLEVWVLKKVRISRQGKEQKGNLRNEGCLGDSEYSSL